MRYADRGKERKEFAYVLDADLKRKFISNGCKLIQTLKDVNGHSVYIFTLDRLSFDISEDISSGKCYISDRCTLSF